MIPTNALEEQASGSVGHRREQKEKIFKKKLLKQKSKYWLTCHRRIM
jgi:hypothetical protein